MKKYNSAVFYRGPSELDGKPIIGIISGLGRGSSNVKTGETYQTYIIRDDLSPIDAIRSGADKSVCGDCQHRSGSDGRSCYVQVQNAPTSLWKIRDTLPNLGSDSARFAPEIMVRLGSYGDPAALPDLILRGLVYHRRWLGYTHQWRDIPQARVKFLQSVLMASVDSAEERRKAEDRGWRTFRVMRHSELRADETLCPASKEAGYRATCLDCGLCDGARGLLDSRRSIAIYGHGGIAAIGKFLV